MGRTTKGVGMSANNLKLEKNEDWDFDEDGNLWHRHGSMWDKVKIVWNDYVKNSTNCYLQCGTCKARPPGNVNAYYTLIHLGKR